MRLLHSKKPGLVFEEFYGEDIPNYVILSHTWFSNDQEVSYQDICDGKGQDRLGYEKIVKCKSLASDYDYFWVDTCCIDKRSSAELSEAINSMFLWYGNAALCYVYLSDVSSTDPEPTETFKMSRWFSRGWTLQELIAPATVVFYSKEWERIAEKLELLNAISDITSIPERVLSGEADAVEFSVAERMSWASNRTTTRIEDEAYSLMGLFNVNMPLLYGEKEKAFRRLQEEILKINADQSLFAWTDPDVKSMTLSDLLARRPKLFAKSKNIESMGLWGKGNVVGVTNRGIRAKLYLIPTNNGMHGSFWASLDCWTDSDRLNTFRVLLSPLEMDDLGQYSPRSTQYVRVQLPNLSWALPKDEKIGGEYRDVYVQDQNLRIQWHLGPYRPLKTDIYIQNPSGPFSVHPAKYWEPQSGLFTAPYNPSGALGVIFVTGEDCVYMAYFGLDEAGSIWVKADTKPFQMRHIRNDEFWMSYQRDGTESNTSELSYRPSIKLSYDTERFTAKVGGKNFHGVTMRLISIDLSRIGPGTANI